MDTTTRKCKKCEEEFDSIYEIDKGICDDCVEEIPQFKGTLEQLDDITLNNK